MKNVLIFIGGGIVGFGITALMYDSLFKKYEIAYEDESIKVIRGTRFDGKMSSVAQVIDK